MLTVNRAIHVMLVGLLVSGCVTSFGGNAALNTPNGQASTAPGGASNAATANKSVKEVQLSPDSFVIGVNSAKDLLATVRYQDGTSDSSVVWSSSDDTIIGVNPTTGKVTGVKQGIATVIAASTADPSKRAIATVTVKPSEVEASIAKITPAEATIQVGATVQLSAEIQLSDGSTSPNVSWSTSNKSVAQVSNGLVTGIAAGSVTVTATSTIDSTKKASATITVTN